MNQVHVVVGKSKRVSHHSSLSDAISSVSLRLKVRIFDREFSDELIEVLKAIFLVK
jgi:hypothetical protein